MRTPIRTKITLFTLSIVFITITASALFSVYYFRSNIITATEDQVAAVGRTTQADIEDSLTLGFSIEELAGVNERLGYLTNSYKEVGEVYVTDTSEKIIFSSDQGRIGSKITYGGGDEAKILGDGSLARQIILDGQVYHEVSIDIHKNGSPVGRLKLNIPDGVVAEKTLPMAEVFLVFALLSLIGSIVSAYIMGGRISKPITDLEAAAVVMAKGNFSAKATKTTDDEIGDLSITFNWMAEEIKKNQEKLEQNIIELRNLLELKNEFLHIIDHQLRTPLSVMRGYLEFWRTGQYQKFTPEKQEDIKHKIITATDQLSSIIHSMIDALEVEGGRLEVKPSEFSLGDLIREIYEVDFADKYNNKGVSFSSDITEAPQVFSDKSYLTAIITNLIDNALKYTPAGEVILRSYTEGPNAVIEIADSGVGLSEGDVAGLFRKFVRGKDAPKISPTGSGIGLYIVRRMIDALNGSIQAYSKGRNQGSLFVVKIPTKHENTKSAIR